MTREYGSFNQHHVMLNLIQHDAFFFFEYRIFFLFVAIQRERKRLQKKADCRLRANVGRFVRNTKSHDEDLLNADNQAEKENAI